MLRVCQHSTNLAVTIFRVNDFERAFEAQSTKQCVRGEVVTECFNKFLSVL
jgi:hypothetical protein